MTNVDRFSRVFLVTVVLVVLAGLPISSHGQSAAIDPKADQTLRKMCDYVGGLEQFSVQTENTLEVVLRSGEKIQYDTPAGASIKRPNKLRADREGDVVNQEFYYDGKTLTLYYKDRNYYATVEAPPTIDEMIDFAREHLDVYAPGGDLIYKNAYSILTEDVISGFYVGMSVVDGVKCHHLAFRGNEVDWQIWIEEGDKPLPKKFIVTSKWMTGAPQFTVVIKSWNLSPKLTDDMFSFVPPKDAQKIDFIRLTSGGASRR
ncbi:MAG: DUF2092 domain-containing protein [Syntrophales bacterium]